MNAAAVANEVQIAWKTRAAEDWLASTRSPRVLHIFDRSCNLINEHGETVSINYPDVPRTPLALTLGKPAEPRPFESWRVFLAENARVVVAFSQKRLEVGRLTLDWSRAASWNASPDWAAARLGLLTWSQGAASLRSLCRTDSPPGSLTPLIFLNPAAPDFLQSSPDKARLNAQLLKKAGPLATGLVAAIADRIPRLVAEFGGALAGLGTGLTPSGDDFLMGVMHALWAWLEAPEAAGLSNWIWAAAAPQTSALSRAWLQTAALGEAGEHWHGLFSALGRMDSAELARHARLILQTGHSSGADALAGFLMTSAAISASSGH